MTDLELLRQYEPVLRYTQGEMFFPCAVETYVARCSLWARPRGGGRGRPPELVTPEGQLTVEQLVLARPPHPNQLLFMRFVQQPLQGLDYQRWRLKDRPPFQSPGRLARVGLTARFIDSLFSLSLLLRGTVPGGTAAAAALRYQMIRSECPAPVYYGRVLRRNGYVVLHYLFFYAMNDWRSSFFGVNDHEADWEQVFVYLTEREDGPHTPAWVAYAAHEEWGDDLRRRWDDPDLTLDGDHPVVYVGAGSHAAYVQPGEYLTLVDLNFLKPVIGAIEGIRRVWRDVLRQGDPTELVERIEASLRVPFVDYARGDGVVIGPDRDHEWTPALIADEVPWVSGYRGLWGLDRDDVLAGEQAPAGPKYTRDGAVRRSWYDPLGWAGLAKVAPADTSLAVLSRHIAELRREITELDGSIAALYDSLPRLDLEVRALKRAPHLRRLHQEREDQLTRREVELQDLTAQRVELHETLAASERYLEEMRLGHQDPPRMHLHRRPRPQPESEVRRGRLAEVWAALSTGLMVLGAALLLFFGANHALVALSLVVVTVVLVENILHRRLHRLFLHVAVGMSIASTLVLVYEFFWQLSLFSIAAIALLILVDNIRELRGR